MSELKLNKLKMQTPDICEENIKKLKELFPQIVSEDKIDFDILKQLLSNSIVEADDERYRLDWVGKKRSLLKANTPINKTLRPCVEESVDFENTKNLYIEGDNFEVLKLLQESYLNKIKMIYIDPPYNTGKDFVYRDNFTQKKDEFEDEIGLRDEEGNKLFKNTDSNGRFHSDWLSMMYERLLISRDLLKDDGVIFISIDDNEVHNLRKICDEAFGDNNVDIMIWNKESEGKSGTLKQTLRFRTIHEYILICYKNKENILFDRISEALKGRENEFQTANLAVNEDKQDINHKNYYEIIAPNGFVWKKHWKISKDEFEELVNDDLIYWGSKGESQPRRILPTDERRKVYSTSIIEKGGTTIGRKDYEKIMPENTFSYPKPLSLINHLLTICKLEENDIVLDFFAGSSSTTHSLFNYISNNKISLKFINIQYPENLIEMSGQAQGESKITIDNSIDFLKSINKPPFITEIAKERIRRAGVKILEENKDKDLSSLDIGFRVLKVDSSNMKDVYYHPADLKQSNLLDFETNIKEDRNDLDLLFSIMLDLGITLDLKITTKTVDDKKLYIIENSELVVCFENSISLEVIEFIKKEKPLKVVLKDGCFENDTKKINAINELL
ncbi:site-specific DNA-methyltransferase [Aliarcobacter cryaerophilus]|uniref:site-specific DNA-methyltransferase n=1 Tax=Aliarcobacter cryaerophilus TaxID=28198 RepID=UPI003DA68DC0